MRANNKKKVVYFSSKSCVTRGTWYLFYNPHICANHSHTLWVKQGSFPPLFHWFTILRHMCPPLILEITSGFYFNSIVLSSNRNAIHILMPDIVSIKSVAVNWISGKMSASHLDTQHFARNRNFDLGANHFARNRPHTVLSFFKNTDPAVYVMFSIYLWTDTNRHKEQPISSLCSILIYISMPHLPGCLIH